MKILPNRARLVKEAYRYIIDSVSKRTNCGDIDIFGKNRKREYVLARHLTMYFIKELHAEVSLKQLGEMFDRDHSTVIHGLTSISDQLATSGKFRKFVSSIEEDIKQKAAASVKEPETIHP